MYCEINENCHLKFLSHFFLKCCSHRSLFPLQSKSDIRKIQGTTCNEDYCCFSNVFVISGSQVKVVIRGGGDSAYESGGDARRLTEGCKFRILDSFRVFWAKRHHI